MVRWLLSRRRLVAPALAALLVTATAQFTDAPLPLAPGSSVAHAQGGMDLGILSPSFRDLPSSVAPGQEFTINAVTVNGASCTGSIAFRGEPVIELAGQAASGDVCSWTVTAPTTARPGTANIGIGLTRNGQQWALYGITYVAPIGESR
ncbi:MAG: hypothetical protein IT306_22705 [Chloroflexi bacterium]|nr:hypothetical protein [Chloroflexota bacterium]